MCEDLVVPCGAEALVDADPAGPVPQERTMPAFASWLLAVAAAALVRTLDPAARLAGGVGRNGRARIVTLTGSLDPVALARVLRQPPPYVLLLPPGSVREGRTQGLVLRRPSVLPLRWPTADAVRAALAGRTAGPTPRPAHRSTRGRVA